MSRHYPALVHLVTASAMSRFHELMVGTADSAGVMNRYRAEELYVAELNAVTPGYDDIVPKYVAMVADAVDKACEPSAEDLAALVDRLQA